MVRAFFCSGGACRVLGQYTCQALVTLPARYASHVRQLVCDALVAVDTGCLAAGQGGGMELRCPFALARDRQRVVSGTSVSVGVDLGGRRLLKKKKIQNDRII